MSELIQLSSIKKSVLEIIDDFLSYSPPETMADHVLRLKENIVNNNFQIAVVATWNTGKSTFLNALQGDPLFPTQNKETTHIITGLIYSKARYTILKFSGRDQLSVKLAKNILDKLNKNYSEKSENQIFIPCKNYKEQKQILEIFSTDDGFLPKYPELYSEIFFEELHEEFPDMPSAAEEYKNVKDNPDVSSQIEIINKWSHITNVFRFQCLRKIQNHLLEIILGVPTRLCEQGVQLIDTPGVVSLDELRDKMVTDYIQFAQCVIFIFRFDQPGNAEDITFQNFIKKMGIKDVFLVLNRIDTQKDPRDVWDAISQVEKGLQNIISGEVHIYPLSSLGTLIAKLRATKDEELIKTEGEFTEFLKRNDQVKLNSYINDFSKFYRDLDNYLLRVDKFDRLMRSPLLFLKQKVKELKQIWIDKRKEQEKDFFYKRYSTYINDLEKINKELTEQKEKTDEVFEEKLEKYENGELYKLIVTKIESLSSLSTEDWQVMNKSGFQLTFKHLLAKLQKDNIEEIDKDLFKNEKYNEKLDNLKTKLKPYYKKYNDESTQLVNILLKAIEDEAKKLYKQWHTQTKKYFDKKFAISLPPAESELLEISEISKAKITFPKKSISSKMKSKVSSIFTLNKTKRLKQLKNQASEIMEHIFKQTLSYFDNNINKNIGSLRNTFISQIEKECSDAITIFKENSKEDEEVGKKVSSKIEDINSHIKNIENLLDKLKLVEEKLPPL